MRLWKELLTAIKFILILCVITIGIQILLDGGVNVESIKGWIVSNFFFGIPFYFANAYLNDGLNKIYSWIDHPKKRTLLGIPAFMMMNSVLMVILIYLFMKMQGVDNPNILSPNNMYSIVIALTICLIATLYFHAVGFFRGYVAQIEVSKKLEEEKVAAELNALKAQVNPHFLFNSFNVLSGLIDEDPPKAKKFLSGLSKIYRYILENRNEDLSTLQEELSFAEQYLSLQKTRFENSIDMEIDVPSHEMGRKLPVLTLQLLLENAIKHNAFNKDNPLRISIKKVEDRICVQNNKSKSRHSLESSGLGHDNIKQRYLLHNAKGFEIEETEDSFRIFLPLI